MAYFCHPLLSVTTLGGLLPPLTPSTVQDPGRRPTCRGGIDPQAEVGRCACGEPERNRPHQITRSGSGFDGDATFWRSSAARLDHRFCAGEARAAPWPGGRGPHRHGAAGLVPARRRTRVRAHRRPPRCQRRLQRHVVAERVARLEPPRRQSRAEPGMRNRRRHPRRPVRLHRQRRPTGEHAHLGQGHRGDPRRHPVQGRRVELRQLVQRHRDRRAPGTTAHRGRRPHRTRGCRFALRHHRQHPDRHQRGDQLGGGLRRRRHRVGCQHRPRPALRAHRRQSHRPRRRRRHRWDDQQRRCRRRHPHRQPGQGQRHPCLRRRHRRRDHVQHARADRQPLGLRRVQLPDRGLRPHQLRRAPDDAPRAGHPALRRQRHRPEAGRPRRRVSSARLRVGSSRSIRPMPRSRTRPAAPTSTVRSTSTSTPSPPSR